MRCLIPLITTLNQIHYLNHILLFLHLTKKIVGAIKIKDGNERALPSVVCTLFKKLKITSPEENKKLLFWTKTPIKNHAKKTSGRIYTIIQ